MSKKQCRSDECLKCPRMLHLQKTPEGKKFCEYCLTRQAILKSNGKIVDNYVFEEDFAMGLHNRLQLWSSRPFACPTCACKDFTVSIETREAQQDGIFKSTPITRFAFTCSNGHRYFPDDVMNTHGLTKQAGNGLVRQATKGLK